MTNPTAKLAILAAIFTLAGCAHAGRRATGRVEPGQAPAEGEGAQPRVVEAAAPVEPPAAAPAAPAEAPPAAPGASAPARPADPELDALRAAAREAEEAVVRTGERAAARAERDPDPGAAEATTQATSTSTGGGSRAGAGALKGMGLTLQVWGKFCLSHPAFAILCVAGLPWYWGYALGAVALGGVIGAAVGADPDPPATPAGAPGRRGGPQHDEPPPAEWGGGAEVAQGGSP